VVKSAKMTLELPIGSVKDTQIGDQLLLKGEDAGLNS
jgi:hypothetical protein